MEITYEHSRRISAKEFRDVLERTTLGVRRPLDDEECLNAMLSNADLVCTSWAGDRLIGVARSVTDFVYCCYLSDLAVDEKFQGRGVGRRLIRLTQSRLGPRAKIILLAAPGAQSYYPHIGMEQHPSAWVVPSQSPVS
ncbi:MAG: GNAT family N-acetyltransferase [Candidatus Methylacidiphilales bacterium]|nr:GNAT family N-acetyltransferase [Candidatus Methylacidiphilales bacterium]